MSFTGTFVKGRTEIIPPIPHSWSSFTIKFGAPFSVGDIVRSEGGTLFGVTAVDKGNTILTPI